MPEITKSYFKSNEISFQIDAISANYLIAKKEGLISFKNTEDQRLPSASCSNNIRSANSTNKNFIFPYNLSGSNNLKINIDAIDKNESLIDNKHYKSDGQLNRLLSDRDSKRDLKFSCSPFQPKYDFSTFGIVKQILIDNHKEISGKRDHEEMKEYLNEWAINKEMFKEQIEKKYELKKLINFYEKSFQEKQEETKSSGVNLENLNMKKSNSPSPIKMRRDKTLYENSFNKKVSLEIKCTDNFHVIPDKRYRVDNNRDDKIHEDPILILKNKIRFSHRTYNSYNRLNFNKVKNYQINNSTDGNENDIYMSKKCFLLIY